MEKIRKLMGPDFVIPDDLDSLDDDQKLKFISAKIQINLEEKASDI